MQPAPAKVSFKEQMHQAREHAILRSACDLLGEKSFDAMTMDDVAGKVGIAKASLYKHFGSKEELCSAAMVEVLSSAQTYLKSLDPALPAVDKLRAVVRWSLERLLAQEMDYRSAGRRRDRHGFAAHCGALHAVRPRLRSGGEFFERQRALPGRRNRRSGAAHLLRWHAGTLDAAEAARDPQMKDARSAGVFHCQPVCFRQAGSSTRSTTWITPLLAKTSVPTRFATRAF